jgi:hypothetical protein
MALGFATGVCAQASYPLTDYGTGEIRVFTNSVGTADTNGTMVVFEGQLDSDLNITSAYNDVSGRYLASVRLLTQIRLFDELPVSNEVGDVQGAVAALKVSSSPDVGLYFAWGVSNSVLTWVPVMNTNGTQFAVADGETNYVTFVFSYPTGMDPVTYQVFIGKDTDLDMTPSDPITSLTTETDGINSLSMLGVGGVQQVGSASGSPSPLSTSIGLSVYTASNSVCADIYTVGERGTMPIKLYAWINGAWVLVGTVPNVYGDGDHKYHILLTGLTPGQSYRFMVIDETGRQFELRDAYEVKTITVGEAALETVTVAAMEMQMLTVTFNTEANRRYKVMISESLTAPANQWTVESVYIDSLGEFVSEFTATGNQSQVRIPVNRYKAFFRIYMLED